MPPASKSGKKLTASPKAKAGGAGEWKNPIHENGFIFSEGGEILESDDELDHGWSHGRSHGGSHGRNYRWRLSVPG